MFRGGFYKKFLALSLVGGFVVSSWTFVHARGPMGGAGKGFTLDKPLPEFKDVKLETQKYIDYFYSLKLSPTEQKTLEQALKPIPAPCCADNSALTC